MKNPFQRTSPAILKEPPTKLALPAWYFTPVEKDHWAGLVNLAVVIDKLLGEVAQPFTIPVIPEAFLHGRDIPAGSGH